MKYATVYIGILLGGTQGPRGVPTLFIYTLCQLYYFIDMGHRVLTLCMGHGITRVPYKGEPDGHA